MLSEDAEGYQIAAPEGRWTGGLAHLPWRAPTFAADFAVSSARRILSGVIGNSLIQTPVALAIACATAPSTGSVVPSPISLAPKGPAGS